MIQQMLPPQKPLLLHIRHTSEKFWSGFTAHSKIFRGSILVQKRACCKIQKSFNRIRRGDYQSPAGVMRSAANLKRYACRGQAYLDLSQFATTSAGCRYFHNIRGCCYILQQPLSCLNRENAGGIEGNGILPQLVPGETLRQLPGADGGRGLREPGGLCQYANELFGRNMLPQIA